MKKIIIGLISIALCFVMSPKHVYAEDNTRPILQIPVISDIHIQNQCQKDRLIKALNDYKIIAPNYNVMVFVGDITDHGYSSEYDNFMNIINNNVQQNAEKVIVMGNHEYNEVWYKGIVQSDIYINRFKEKTKMPNVYYDKWIAGYHFITLGADDLNYNSAADGRISDKEYSWLEIILAVNANANKPIFVFLHQPIPYTVYGSQHWGGNFTDGKLFNILKKYPQVILFTGHSHALLDYPRTVYQNGFNMVNTGSVAYTCYDGGKGPEEYSQGLLVNVYNDRVEIKSREFSTGTYIKTFVIKIPYKKNL
ncbi:MAG: purple acid phosphatase/fibronectin domain protein [Clostridiaceae bacterium]|jgi:3',5'-cyclic AMP phosphodiesterase CpdA|nr:purple acid phosphatase/fibronectin domain protein [Clostridiaceae bacterium]